MGRLFQPRNLEDFEEPIWNRQSTLGETNDYYAMFLAFCNIRPTSRTVASSWREWTKGTPQEGTLASSTYSQIANAFHWSERAAARDVQELRERYSQWGQRDWDWRENDYKTGDTLRAKAEEALKDMNLSEFKPDIATIISMLQTASNLQKGSIPNIGALSSTQIQDILAALPDAKRKRVLRIVMAEYKDEPVDTSAMDNAIDNVIEGEVKRLPGEKKSTIGRHKPRNTSRIKAEVINANPE